MKDFLQIFVTRARDAGRRAVPAGAALLLLAAAADAAPDTVIHAGRLLAVPGEPVRERQSIVIESGRILEVRAGFVSPDELAGDGAAPRLIDLSESFVLPGLIDAHVHITSESAPGFKLRRVVSSGPDQAISAVMNARRTLMAGFTTVRDTAGFRGADFEGLQIAAHQLKGSGGGYGYDELTECAAKLEAHARSRELEGCVSALDELRDLTRRVRVAPDP